MKIGIDARFFGPGSKGLGRYTQKLIIHLEHIDHENEYVIFLRKENFDLYTPKNKNFTKVLADYQWYSFAEQIFFPITLYKQGCDIVHFPHFNVPLLYFKKFVVTIHDLILLRYPTRKASTLGAVFYWSKFLMYRIVIVRVVQKAKIIIAVSQFTKDDIQKQFKVADEKIVVIYEAAEIGVKLPKNTDEILKKYGIINSYMLYVGNAYPHKNLYALVDAFAHYKNDKGTIKKLVLVGTDDYFYRNLQLYITKNKIQDIIILHTIEDVLLRVLYERTQLFVFPSLYEGFGLPPLEAQLVGVPVLSSKQSCMQEVLSVDGAKYCDTEDIVAFSNAMKLVDSDKNLRQSLIMNGHKNVKQYSWQKMATQIHNIYTNNI